MTPEILNFLKDSENFEEFVRQADIYIATEIAQEQGIFDENGEPELEDILNSDMRDRAKEYWTEHVNNSF